jgi:periplasmic divalent cation tolerance protein
MPESYCVVLTTTGAREEAEILAELLVTRKLAACVQISAISSYYAWNGQLHKDQERLLLIKTRSACFDALQAAILDNHSYEVPEIVQIPIERGLPAYLEWITTSTT